VQEVLTTIDRQQPEENILKRSTTTCQRLDGRYSQIVSPPVNHSPQPALIEISQPLRFIVSSNESGSMQPIAKDISDCVGTTLSAKLPVVCRCGLPTAMHFELPATCASNPKSHQSNSLFFTFRVGGAGGSTAYARLWGSGFLDSKYNALAHSLLRMDFYQVEFKYDKFDENSVDCSLENNDLKLVPIIR
jgi:hypothetical protein